MTLAAPLLAGILIVLAPGLVATAPIGVRGLGRFAVSGVAGVFCLGVAGVAFSLAGVAFAPWQSLVVALAIGAIAAVARRVSRGDWMPRSRAPRRRALVAIGVAWLAASVLIELVAFWGVASPESFSQTYDNVFHLSAVAHILQSGDASSLTLRTMIETGKSFAFYPSGWHSLVAAIVIAVVSYILGQPEWLPGSDIVVTGTLRSVVWLLGPMVIAAVLFAFAAVFGQIGSLALYIRHKARAQIMRSQQTEPH